MPYVPNATETTQPTSDKFVESAALEFRTLKVRIAEIAALVGSGGGGSAGVASFNTRTGIVTLSSADVLTALKEGADTAGGASIATTPANSTSNSFAIRRTANYTGGTPGWVNSGMLVETTVSSAATSFEWAILGVLSNRANGGENVAGYFQGLKQVSAGCPTWAGCMEASDLSYLPVGPTTGGLVALEVDNFAVGTDAYDRRIGIDMVAGNSQFTRTGVFTAKCEVSHGIRFAASNLDNAKSAYLNAITIMSADKAGIWNSASGIRGIRHSGTYQIGIDLSESTNSTAAIRIKADDKFMFEATNAISMRYNSAAGRIEFDNAGTSRGYITMLSGVGGDLAGVNLTSAQTISGAKTFSNIITANAGITGTGGIFSAGVATTGIDCTGDIGIGPTKTLLLNSSGNVRAASGTSSLQFRVFVDGAPYYIPLYS